MGWDGSGNVIRDNGTNTGQSVWQDDADASVRIRADRHDNHDQDLANAIENSVALDGQNTTTTGNSFLRFDTGANKFSGVAVGNNELVARQSNNLTGISIAASRIVGRKATGDVGAVTAEEAQRVLGDDEHATDSGTDAYVSATTTAAPAAGVRIYRDFQSPNTTTTPTLDALTITTKDGSALWPGALSGVHELQYASSGPTWRVVDPNPVGGDQPVSREFTFGDAALLLAPDRRVSNDNFTKHKAFGVVDVSPVTGVIVNVYREGDEHGISEAILRVTTSSDSGITWSDPETVRSESGDDIRNIGGGFSSSGRFHIIYERINVSDEDDSSTEAQYSDDDGDTWSTVVDDIWNSTNGNRIPGYGLLVTNDSGDIMLFGTPTSNTQIKRLYSEDDGVTWEQEEALSLGGTEEVREISAVNVGSNRIVAVGRDNSSEDSNPYIFTSDDGGTTFSSLDTISNIQLGQNPPILWYSEKEDRIYLIFPTRGSESYTSDSALFAWWWMISSITPDEIFSGNGVWRKPWALPIASPHHRIPGGDSGYQHVWKNEDGVFMVYYKGNYDNGEGTDFFQSNLTAIAGVV